MRGFLPVVPSSSPKEVIVIRSIFTALFSSRDGQSIAKVSVNTAAAKRRISTTVVGALIASVLATVLVGAQTARADVAPANAAPSNAAPAGAPGPWTVTYDGNTNTSGDAPTDGASGTYMTGDSVTVLSQNTLLKDGNNFLGWTFDQPGNSGYLTAGAQFVIRSNVTLYAQWDAQKYTCLINWDYPSASGGSQNDHFSGNCNGSVPVTYNETVTLPTSAPTGVGYHFDYWTVNGDGVTHYNPGDTFRMPSNDTTFTTHWLVNTHTVSYGNGGGTGSTDPTGGSAANTYNYGETITVPTAYSYGAPSGQTFNGWKIQGGDGHIYNPGDTFLMPDRDITLIPDWSSSSYGCTLDFNGGSIYPGPADNVGYNDSQDNNWWNTDCGSGFSWNDTYTMTTDTPTYDGYDFVNWTVKMQGQSDFQVNPGDYFYVFGDFTIQANWTGHPFYIKLHTLAHVSMTSRDLVDISIQAIAILRMTATSSGHTHTTLTVAIL